MKAPIPALFVFLFLLIAGCSKETVDPNFTGSIKGSVQNSHTGLPIAGASVTTSPGTDAVLTDQEGNFTFEDIPTGNYTVKVKKDSFATETVRLAVEENRVTTASILLKKNDVESPMNSSIQAEVTFFNNFNYGPRDSIYVHVEYRFENISTEGVGNYEVYFKIDTADSSFYHEVKGDSLAAGEQTPGKFKKYIYQFKAQKVAVTGVYTQDRDS
ncbi:MAG TPA: carboxypeptidase-like regulatory domain-containing protein [Fodinibius sp.]|nr:carboxypeptidase-like regulatory domain-containing protein [Fodinibius sp.]